MKLLNLHKNLNFSTYGNLPKPLQISIINQDLLG